MSLNALVRLSLSSSATRGDGFVKQSRSPFSSRSTQMVRQPQPRARLLVVQARGKQGMRRQFQRQPPPSLPKLEDDGNPNFVIFTRMANVYLWFPVTILKGGSTAKAMVAVKDNFLGKYMFKDTLARNLASVIYKDEKEIRKNALEQHRALRGATEFRYGYKLVENGNLRAALYTSNVVELPTPDKLKTVVDKVKDFFEDAKESFGKLIPINSTPTKKDEGRSKKRAKVKG